MSRREEPRYAQSVCRSNLQRPMWCSLDANAISVVVKSRFLIENKNDHVHMYSWNLFMSKCSPPRILAPIMLPSVKCTRHVVILKQRLDHGLPFLLLDSCQQSPMLIVVPIRERWSRVPDPDRDKVASVGEACKSYQNYNGASHCCQFQMVVVDGLKPNWGVSIQNVVMFNG
jgi:hypothetical protein